MELAELLSWATAHCVLDEDDRQLLVGLAEAVCRVEVPRGRQGLGGLCSTGRAGSGRVGSGVVVAQHGISEATVRRRNPTQHAALAEACAPQMSA